MFNQNSHWNHSCYSQKAGSSFSQKGTCAYRTQPYWKQFLLCRLSVDCIINHTWPQLKDWNGSFLREFRSRFKKCHTKLCTHRDCLCHSDLRFKFPAYLAALEQLYRMGANNLLTFSLLCKFWILSSMWMHPWSSRINQAQVILVTQEGFSSVLPVVLNRLSSFSKRGYSRSLGWTIAK